MINEKEIYQLVLIELIKLREWSKMPKSKESFDFDETYSILKKRYGDIRELPFINEIYSLTDVLIDSLRHEMKLINKDYTVIEALRDLDMIISILKQDDYSKLNLQKELKLRLSNDNLYR